VRADSRGSRKKAKENPATTLRRTAGRTQGTAFLTVVHHWITTYTWVLGGKAQVPMSGALGDNEAKWPPEGVGPVKGNN
jgi:hypothetical protein